MTKEKKKPVKMVPDNLQKQIKECEKIRDEYLAGWQRAKADFSNYKKDETERNKALLEYALRNLFMEMMPISDSFGRAEQAMTEQDKNNEAFQGFLQIKKQFDDFLKSQDVEEIKTIGEKFDPNFHEAVVMVEVEDEEKDIIIEEVQKGYVWHERVIRPAKVKISK